MVIKVEYNPELALRNISEFKNHKRRKEECIPEKLVVGNIYPFLKKDQRNFWLYGNVPLVETTGSEIVSNPRASILILEVTHYMEGEDVYTKGLYKVLKVCNGDSDCSVFSRIGLKK